MKKFIVSVILFDVFFSLPVFGQNRSFKDVYPNMDENRRTQAFSNEGVVVSGKSLAMQLAPATSGLDITSPILNRKPRFLTESLEVIPYNKNVSLLNIYNALGNIRGLKGRLYHSATKNKDIPLFEDATRVESAKKTTAIPDPPAKTSLPTAPETFYICLKDANFGKTYYRADISITNRAILCTLYNFKALTFMLVPVIKEDKFVAQMYFEPIAEGLLLYSIAGADVSDFAAKQIDVASAVRKRLEVIDQWVIDGIK
jgi:hypothetical protein